HNCSVATWRLAAARGWRVRRSSWSRFWCWRSIWVGSRSCRIHRAEELNADGVDALLAQALQHALLVVAAEADVVLDLLDGLAAVSVSHEHAAAGGVGRPSFTTADVPCVANHELEVVIVVDGR